MAINKVPDFPPKIFHRIWPTSPQAMDRMLNEQSVSIVSKEAAAKFAVGHGLILAKGESAGPATVFALGVVTVKGPTKEPIVAWTRTSLELPVTGRLGGHHREKPEPTFKFDPGVADAFGLKDLFRKHVSNPFDGLR